jgi:hypothetical protein
MLEWLSSGRNGDSSHREGSENSQITLSQKLSVATDEDNIVDDDAPATPAPVFAARAFKHLIWGTPAPEEMAKQRGHLRRTNSEDDQKAMKTPPRRSTSEGVKRGQLAEPSPAKRPGILLTPGTGGLRRKTVSFEGKANVMKMSLDIDTKVVATPRDVPGRFPSPWTVKKELVLEDEQGKAPLNKNSHTTATNQHLASPRRRSSAPEAIPEDTTIDMSAPRSTSGTYWKSEYETYSSKSTAEMRKLAKKEQLAKKYARDRNDEAAALANALRREQERVQELEQQVTDYVLQLQKAVKEYEADGKLRRDREQRQDRKVRPQKDAEHLQAEMLRLLEENKRLKAEVQGVSKAEASRSDETPSSKNLPPPPSSTDSKAMWMEVVDEENQKPRRRADRTRRTEKQEATSRAALQSRDANPLLSSPFPEPDKTRPTPSDMGRSYRRHDVKQGDTLGQKNTTKSHVMAKSVDVVVVERAVPPKIETSVEADGKRLSDERKEAAKRRLEEKRRLRASQAACV